MIERPGKIVAIGLNYMDHVRESGAEPPEQPLRVRKFTTSLIGDGEAIRIPRALTERVDWEVELAVVIDREAHARVRGGRARPTSAATPSPTTSPRATCSSPTGSGSAPRAWTRSARSARSSSRSTTRRTSSSITRVNGEVVQDSSTSEMIFGVAELISFCSHTFTLEPGDVILTGTPWGCGEFMDPKRSLKDGDVVECEIEGVGVLRNPVVEV